MSSTIDEIDHTKSTSTFHENDVTPFDKSTGDSSAKTSNIESSSAEHSMDKINETANSSKPKGWVQFEDEDDKSAEVDKIPKMENVDLSDKVNEFFFILNFVI